MKKNIFKVLMLTGLAALTYSCSDVKELGAGYEDKFTNNGAPQIQAIYDVQDTELENPLTDGVLNQYIHIKGVNLAKATRININGLEVDLASRAYTECNDAYIRIPRAIPENETGVIEYETAQGKTTYEFGVSIPALELEGLVNEFTFQGERAQLSGDYFDLYDFNDTTETSPVKITIRNEELGYEEVVKCDSCTEEFTSIIIPKDCPDGSLITFEWNAMGGTRASKTVSYRNSSSLLFGNFDGDLGWWNDMGKEWLANCQLSDAPASLGYQYLRLLGTFNSWDWDISGLGCSWPLDITMADIDNYEFKFEVCTSPSTPFVNYGDNGKYGNKNGGYRMTLAGAPERGQFDPVSDGLTNTNGKWVTIRMPLSDVMIGLEAMPAPGDWVSLEFGTQPNTDDAWVIDHSFGQFRVEKKY